MSDSFFDKFIADLVKGAEVNSRANGGPGVNVLIDREHRGHEEKLANHAGLGAALGGMIPIPGAGMIGGAIGADEGRGWPAAGGALLGGLGGALGGGALGGHLGGPETAKLLAYLGSIGGGAAGAQHFGEDKRNILQRAGDKLAAGIAPELAELLGSITGDAMRNPQIALPAAGAGLGALTGAAGGGPDHRLEGAAKGALVGGGLGLAGPAAATYLAKEHPQSFMSGMMPKMSALQESLVRGSDAALTTFGVKEAFLPALMAGAARIAPMIGRAFSAAKPALGAAGNFLMKNPVGQQVAGAAAGSVVNRAMAPQQPQPQPAMG